MCQLYIHKNKLDSIHTLSMQSFRVSQLDRLCLTLRSDIDKKLTDTAGLLSTPVSRDQTLPLLISLKTEPKVALVVGHVSHSVVSGLDSSVLGVIQHWTQDCYVDEERNEDNDHDCGT